MYFLSDTVTPMQFVFPFLLTETSHKESILLIYFALVIILVILVNVFYRIARFFICNYVNGRESQFWLVIFNYFLLYRLKIMSINQSINQSIKLKKYQKWVVFCKVTAMKLVVISTKKHLWRSLLRRIL